MLTKKTAVLSLKEENAKRAQGLAGRKAWGAKMGHEGLSFRRERTTTIPTDPKYKELAYTATPLDHSYAPLSPDVEHTRTESGEPIFTRTLQDATVHKDQIFEALLATEDIPQMWSDRTIPHGNSIGKITSGDILKTAVDGQDYLLIPIIGPNRESILAEAQLIFHLQKFRGGWFPTVIGYYREPRSDPKKAPGTYLVTPVQSRGSKPPVTLTLEKYMEVHRSDGKMTDIKNILTILRDIAWNINCLNLPANEESTCLILRNISPQTFLVREPHEKGEKTQIVDLGFLLPCKDAITYTSDRNFPIWTIAPEVYEDKEFHQGSDVYAFGHLMLHVFIGQNAWIRLGKSPRTFIEELKSKTITIPPRSANMPIEIYELVEECLNPDFSKRPTILQVFEDLKAILRKLVEGSKK